MDGDISVSSWRFRSCPPAAAVLWPCSTAAATSAARSSSMSISSSFMNPPGCCASAASSMSLPSLCTVPIAVSAASPVCSVDVVAGTPSSAIPSSSSLAECGSATTLLSQQRPAQLTVFPCCSRRECGIQVRESESKSKSKPRAPPLSTPASNGRSPDRRMREEPNQTDPGNAAAD